jgi:hypothetical protein
LFGATVFWVLAMKRPFVRLLALCVCLFAACLAGTSQASGPSYELHGVFAPTDRAPNPQFVATTPPELVGKSFTVTVSWPDSASDYTSDFQASNDHYGEYGSELISVHIDVPGFDFTGPPTPSLSDWETWNDTVLSYDYGVPKLSGDELRLTSRVSRSQTYMYETLTSDGHTQLESFTSTTDYTMSMRAVDTSGNHFSDDSLQTNFDLTSFGSIFFEFQQVVPVSGSTPRPFYVEHWLGVVDSVIAVPEPGCAAILSWAVAGAIVCRRGRKRT